MESSKVLAHILAGGLGTRLGLGNLPKALVDIEGQTLFTRQITELQRAGFEKIFVHAGFGAEQIIAENLKHQNLFRHLDIKIQIEETPLGTAGSMMRMNFPLDADHLVVYGDTLFDIDFSRMLNYFETVNADMVLYTHPSDHAYDSDIVSVNSKGQVINVSKPPHPVEQRGTLVNAACYLITEDARAHAASHFLNRRRQGRSETKLDWAHDIIPFLVQKRKVFSYRGIEYVRDIGTPERLQRGIQDFKDGVVGAKSCRTSKRAIFVDRDGVVTPETAQILGPNDVQLLDGAAKGIRILNECGVPVIMITNQPAVAKGLCTYSDIIAIHSEIEFRVSSEENGIIDEWFVCPHHPERGWLGEDASLKVQCECRKPLPGLFYQASEKFNIALSESVYIGDSLRDYVAATAAGVDFIGVGGPVLRDSIEALIPARAGTSINIYSSLLEAAESLRSQGNMRRFQ